MGNEKLKILVVEDEAGIAELEREVLEGSGYDVQEVAEGARALEILAENPEISLLVLDYRLPDMSGLEVLKALAKRSQSPPVVMVTGYTDPDIEKGARAAGVRDFLVKGPDLQFLRRLPEVVREMLAHPPL